MPRSPVIVVQGGAGDHTAISGDDFSISQVEEGVMASARAGYAVLSSGGSAVDAVDAAVVAMEERPVFNCGKGSCLTLAGTIEMDASIMDGTNLSTGAVTCVEGVANPIKVARAVMEQTPHVLLAGQAAKKFAMECELKMATVEDLITEKSVNRLKNYPKFKPSAAAEFYENKKLPLYARDPDQSGHGLGCTRNPSPQPHVEDSLRDPNEHDTVGAVAMDVEGHVAYATSTGGITAKMPGRVGDSPLVGCGGYADDVSGAVSTTGHGEAFVKTTLARHVSFLMEQGGKSFSRAALVMWNNLPDNILKSESIKSGESAQQAVEKALQYCLQRVGGQGGCVAIDSLGGVGIHWTSVSMAWASVKDEQLKYGVFRQESNWAEI